MFFPDEPFYVINGFSPRADIMLSRYDFFIGLKSDIALKAYETEISDYTIDKLEEFRKNILKSCGMKYSDVYLYRFIENDLGKNTFLLQSCQVEGTACDMGISGTEVAHIKDSFNKKDLSHIKMVGYYPHNIDNMHQAYSLLSIWLQWADLAFVSSKKFR